jgi:hypothetical protein
VALGYTFKFKTREEMEEEYMEMNRRNLDHRRPGAMIPYAPQDLAKPPESQPNPASSSDHILNPRRKIRG